MAKKRNIARNYHCKDVEMLLAAKIILSNLSAHLSELRTVRSNWTAAYVSTMETRIDSAITNFLGLDVKRDLREATRVVLGIQSPALRDIAFFKTQIDSDYSKDKTKRNEILRTLGFTDHLKAAQNKDQEALIELLYKFKANMTGTLRAYIARRGMMPALIDNITGYCDILKKANVTQETLKGSTKVVTNTAITEFNIIYDAINSICKIAYKNYIKNKVIRDKFVLSKAVKGMNFTDNTDNNNEENA